MSPRWIKRNTILLDCGAVFILRGTGSVCSGTTVPANQLSYRLRPERIKIDKKQFMKGYAADHIYEN
jgi:hypothetical protein